MLQTLLINILLLREQGKRETKKRNHLIEIKNK